MHRKVKVFLYCFLIIVIAISCQPKDTFSWNAGFSAPKYYGATGPFVEYFYQGQSIAGASSGVGINPGWGITSGGYVGGDKYKPVPDSIAVKWICGVDRYSYEGGSKLPRNKMLELFKTKAIDSYGNQQEYSLIVAGMAPGGNVTIWMQGGTDSTEICKFKTENKGVWKENDTEYNKYITEHRTISEAFKESNLFWKIHGIPYSVWEKGEKEYDYDIVFCNEDELIKYDRRITGYTKDGSVISSNSDKTSFATLEWNKKFNARDINKKYKNKIPVHFFVQRSSKNNKQWCDAEIVLPNNFEELFSKPYINLKTGNAEHYNRIIIGIEKKNKKTPYLFGRIWVSGINKQDEIMRFRIAKFDTVSRKFLVSKYSLPKDFVFPKWEGREPIEFQELDYWQEK
ncbi:DUF2931 family protein [Flavobacterium plurextorum]|uniref:DUF2931 family protein n=1 Tax=Flavobacterium plurextorum TaxID=1114867 RepID=UPI003757B863